MASTDTDRSTDELIIGTPAGESDVDAEKYSGCGNCFIFSNYKHN